MRCGSEMAAGSAAATTLPQRGCRFPQLGSANISQQANRLKHWPCIGWTNWNRACKACLQARRPAPPYIRLLVPANSLCGVYVNWRGYCSGCFTPYTRLHLHAGCWYQTMYLQVG